jgi:hypothetical protein
MITITGLTHKQKVLMDVMWTMDSMERVQAFVKTLPKKDAQDCLSLITMATQDSLELEGLDEYAEAADYAISRARSC